jgi:hypothetical protein
LSALFSAFSALHFSRNCCMSRCVAIRA